TAIVENIPRSFVFEKTVLPTLAGGMRRIWRFRETIEIALTGLALEVYRSERGEYPETLAALVPRYLPQVPIDLYTRAPVVYQRTKEGAIVYSYGPNYRDDGGIDDYETERDDISWHAGYIPPPKRIQAPEN